MSNFNNDTTSFYEKLLADYDQKLNFAGVNGQRLAQRLAALAQIGLTSEGGSERIGFTKEEKQAKDLVKEWMEAAGLLVREDGAGNIIGRLAGTESTKAILSGSHVDSVPNGGHFDGPLGVLAALEVVEAWKEVNYKPKKSYEVVIFTDEEGARFNGGLTGSQAMMGELDLAQQVQLKDYHGVSFEKVIEESGLSLAGIKEAQRDLSELEAYIEVHIEQGKVLEKANVPVGIVTGIAGPCWLKASFHGEAGHAGNTPMNDRKDALVAASQFVVKVQQLASTVSDSAVATVGKLHVFPNGVNVIPGEVQLTLDIRDIYSESRDKLVELILTEGANIAKEYHVEFNYEETLRIEPVPIKEEMLQYAEQAIKNLDLEPVFLPSGAGHDAMVLGKHIPVAMLFVQSKNGISHNPKEWSSLNHCILGVHALKKYIELIMEK